MVGGPRETSNLLTYRCTTDRTCFTSSFRSRTRWFGVCTVSELLEKVHFWSERVLPLLPYRESTRTRTSPSTLTVRQRTRLTHPTSSQLKVLLRTRVRELEPSLRHHGSPSPPVLPTPVPLTESLSRRSPFMTFRDFGQIQFFVKILLLWFARVPRVLPTLRSGS